MAHVAEIQALTGDLVRCLTSTTAGNRRVNALCDSALRTIRHNSCLLTNQFDVQHRLDGLEERLRINHREFLANILHSRRDALAGSALGRSPHVPELLHLLLELADQPVYKTDIDKVQGLLDEHSGAKYAQEPVLRWEDIAREDGWADDADLWRQASFDDSSDDEGSEGPLSQARGDGNDNDESDTSLDDGELVPEQLALRFAVSQGDATKLQQAMNSQLWRTEPRMFGSSPTIMVCEYDVLRESLAMLHGLPTTLFNGECAPLSSYQLKDVTADMYQSLLTAYSTAGRGLQVLRLFAQRSQAAPHWQVFQDCVLRGLADLDREITKVESQLVDPGEVDRDGAVIVSMMATFEKLKPHMEPLLALSDIVRDLPNVADPASFRHLELLFDATTMAQLTGRDRVCEFLARIFLESFQVYVRPMRLWMEEGQLLANDALFFVSEAATRVPPAQVWSSQYALRRNPDGTLHAPSFLQSSAERIFTAGKSIVVLKNLGKFEAARRLWRQQEEPSLSFDGVCSQGTPGWVLTPFPELFGQAFDCWIQSKHHAISSTLKRILFGSCGLERALDALEQVYFMRDGAVADVFASKVFRMLERDDDDEDDWNHSRALTSFAQEAFAAHLDTTRLSISLATTGLAFGAHDETPRGLVRRRLAGIKPHYQLSWPIEMIILPEAIPRYQAVFTLLLQLRQATCALGDERMLLLPYHEEPQSRCAQNPGYFLLRAKMLWFCTTIRSYLTTLVLAPACMQLREALRQAEDVDAIISVHVAFAARVFDEACLGSKLDPIREAMIVIFELAVRLNRAVHRLNKPEQAHKEWSSDEDDDGGVGVDVTDKSGRQKVKLQRDRDDKPLAQILREIKDELERQVRFVVVGLRGVARSASGGAAAKLDLLAQMLETGSR